MGGILDAYGKDLKLAGHIETEECIGEIAFLTGSQYVMKYVAARRATLFRLERAALDALRNSVSYNFRKIDDFAGVMDEDEIFKYCRVVTLAKDEILLKAATKSNDLYYVLKGALIEGSPANHVVYAAKMYYGQLGLLGGYPTTVKSDIVARDDDTKLFVMSKEGFNSEQFEGVRHDLQDAIEKEQRRAKAPPGEARPRNIVRKTKPVSARNRGNNNNGDLLSSISSTVPLMGIADLTKMPSFNSGNTVQDSSAISASWLDSFPSIDAGSFLMSSSTVDQADSGLSQKKHKSKRQKDPKSPEKAAEEAAPSDELGAASATGENSCNYGDFFKETFFFLGV